MKTPGKWTLNSHREQLRLKPLLGVTDQEDQLAASPEELDKRAYREMGIYALEYLLRKGVVDKVLHLPEGNFYFSDIGIKGNDVPRFCSNARIVEPARNACHCRWAKVLWKTTEVYPMFLEARRTKMAIDRIRKLLPDTISKIDDKKIVAWLRGTSFEELDIDDNVVRCLK